MMMMMTIIMKKYECLYDTVHYLINRKATVASRLPAGTAYLTTKRYKIFPIRVKYRSMKTIFLFVQKIISL
jgi:hypothetical protein